MSERDQTPDPTDESDWPTRTDWFTLAEQIVFESRERNYQEQLRSIGRERNRRPEPSPRRPPWWPAGCRHQGGLVWVQAWRDGWDTYRCKYCLTWTQKMTPVA